MLYDLKQERMKTTKFLGTVTTLLLISFSFILINSCNKDNDNNGGNLIIKIIDDPFPANLVEEANVTISKIEIREKTQDEGDPYIILLETPVSYNLLELRNGFTADLPDFDVPVGEYDLIRLYISEASAKLKDGTTYNLTVPSGAQTGIKVFIKPSIQVQGGLTSELILDFDVNKSFVALGNFNSSGGIEGFHFKPVVRAVNSSTAGRIVGTVSDTSFNYLMDASVWIEKDTIISFTITDTLGFYALIGIPVGTYSIYATKMDHDTVTYPSIEVIGGNQTLQDFILTPLQ